MNAVQKVEKPQQQIETPPNIATQVEITSSGRRRIRPLKFNDFADIKPKSTSNENLVARHSQQELEIPVKERRRRRRGDREVIEMGSPLKDYDDTKRTRYHANSTKLEGEERTSKRKISLNDDELDVTTVHKRQRTVHESSRATTPTRHTRGRSITTGTNVKDDVPIEVEKTHKRRRTTGIQSIDESNTLENIQIKEEPRTNQPEITRFGKLTSSAEKSHRENRFIAQQPVIKSEQIEAPRRGRKPKQPKQPKQPRVFESDTQSESTDAGRKFGRPQRLSRAEPNYTSDRRSSRNLSTQEQPNSPLTGASTEPSGDECLKSSGKRSGRRHSRRSRIQSITDQDVMQPPIVENHSEDDIDSVVDDEPVSLRKTKTVLADIFTKAAGKRGKRKRSSPIVTSKIHGHRTSGRIAAAAAKRQPSPSSDGHSASTPHHSHGGGGTSSDDQQIINKKQMTLPEMMQMQKAKNSTAEQR